MRELSRTPELKVEELDFEFYLSLAQSLLRSDSELATKQAQKYHALAVMNPLRNWIGTSVNLSKTLTNENARFYMSFGAGRRMRMVFYAYRNIIFTATPDRDDPLSHDQQLELTRDINIIYMNIRGILDNFAWCIIYEKDPEATKTLNRMEVDLFSAKFIKRQCFSEIKEEISAHNDWNKEVKERRDPVAHRIPLYIPPAILTDEEAEIYKNLTEGAIEDSQNGSFDEADSKFQQSGDIGTFFPYFQHHPEQGCIPIYPTIPSDIVHLIRIGDIVQHSLLKI